MMKFEIWPPLSPQKTYKWDFKHETHAPANTFKAGSWQIWMF